MGKARIERFMVNEVETLCVSPGMFDFIFSPTIDEMNRVRSNEFQEKRKPL